MDPDKCTDPRKQKTTVPQATGKNLMCKIIQILKHYLQ